MKFLLLSTVVCLLVGTSSLLSAHAAQIDQIVDIARRLHSENPIKRYKAAREARKLGKNAEPLIEPLVSALGDRGAPIEDAIQYFGPRVQDVASQTLVRIGAPAVPALGKALASNDTETREWAAITLGRIGSPAKGAYGVLTVALNDSKWVVRSSAISAIAKIGVEPKTVVPLLTQIARKANDSSDRKAAIVALRDADPEGKLALPILLEALKDDPNGDVMSAAALTLGALGSNARSATPDLTTALSTDKRRGAAYFDVGYQSPVRLDVLRALAEVGPDASAITTLTKTMNEDKQSSARIWAATALVRSTSTEIDRKVPFNLIVKALHDSQDNAQDEAAEALALIGSDAAIKVLIESLQMPDESEYGDRKESSADAIGKIGASAQAAIPALRAAMFDNKSMHSGVRRAAVMVLGKIGRNAKVAVPDLTYLLDSSLASDDIWLQEEIENALESIGPEAAEDPHLDKQK